MNIMKTFVVVSLLFTLNAQASYHRFWVGYKKPEVSAAKFSKGLNTVFFQKTIQTGKGKGLLAYQPYLIKKNDIFPDEIALVTYESEAKYLEIRATAEGKAYGEMHWDYFVKEKSKSTVSEAFNDALVIDAAYELNPDFKNFQTSHTAVYFYVINNPQRLVSLKKEFERLRKDKHVMDSVILVKKNYAIEYRIFDQAPVKPVNALRSLQLSDPQPLAQYGQGVNFKF